MYTAFGTEAAAVPVVTTAPPSAPLAPTQPPAPLVTTYSSPVPRTIAGIPTWAISTASGITSLVFTYKRTGSVVRSLISGFLGSLFIGVGPAVAYMRYSKARKQGKLAW